jgi:HEAT repeat protein
MATVLATACFTGYVIVPLYQTGAVLSKLPKGLAAQTNAQKREVIRELGGKRVAADRLLFYLRMPEWLVSYRDQAAGVLTECEKSALQRLALFNFDSNWQVRFCATEAIGKTMPPDGYERLMHMLSDPSSTVLQRVVCHLRQFKDPRSIGPLLDCAAARGDKKNEIVIGGLVAPGREGIPNLIAGLRHKNPAAREVACMALMRVGGHQVVEPLINALTDSDWQVRREAAYALGELRDLRAFEGLVAALRDQRSEVRLDAVHALYRLRDVRALEPLKMMLSDEDQRVRKSAEDVIRRLQTQQSESAQ